MKKITILIIVLIIAVSIFLLLKNIDNNDENQDLLAADKYEDTEIVENEIENNSNAEIDKQQFIRTDSQGRVDVGVLFKNVVEDNRDYLIFEMMLNTHSVDLEKIDYEKLVKLQNDSGLIVNEGFTWKKTEGSGHHIFGYLRVPKQYKGKDIINDSTKFIELEIKGLDDIKSRKFTWEEDVMKYLKNQ